MKIPPHETALVQWLADLTIIALHQNPVHMFMLRTLDCLCIDELGLISSEFLAVWDIVLRNICQCLSSWVVCCCFVPLTVGKPIQSMVVRYWCLLTSSPAFALFWWNIGSDHGLTGKFGYFLVKCSQWNCKMHWSLLFNFFQQESATNESIGLEA